MASTTLDPNTALIVVDLQKGIAGYPLIHPIGEVVDQTRALLDAFRGCGLPIVLVNVAGRAPGRTERGPRQPLVHRRMDRLPA
jgi:nicotinamidase-related amidase